jgi:integrase
VTEISRLDVLCRVFKQSLGGDIMKKQNNLVRRKHTYYVRKRIPESLQYLIRKKEFCQSLGTNNLPEALDLLQPMLYKIDNKIKLLREIDMEVKKGILMMEEADLLNMVKQRLLALDEVTTENRRQIRNGSYDPEQLLVCPPTPLQEKQAANPRYTEEQYRQECIEKEVHKYLETLFANHRIPPQAALLLEDVKKGKNQLINKKNPEEWVHQLANYVDILDEYTLDKVEEVKTKKAAFIPPLLYPCWISINNDKVAKMNSRISGGITWKAAFDKYREKKTADGVSANTIDDTYKCLETVFEIIGKKYIQDIGYEDVQNVSEQITYLPTHWKSKFPRKKISDVLEQKCEDRISKTTKIKYLGALKQFLAFCKRKRYLKEDLTGDIEIPKRRKEAIKEPFTQKDLKAIFNPETYPRRVSLRYEWRYWIPLIALYSGMRINEISQLYTDDIVQADDFSCEYFLVSDNRKDQSVKNQPSRRRVPIHPKLIEMGFDDFVKRVRQEKRERLFYQLKYSKESHYSGAVSNWFNNRYLKKIGVKKAEKSFHSFRHTFKPMIRDAAVPQEYQNAICGWEANGIGEKVYGHKIPINILYQEIQKVQYPFLDKLLAKIKEKNVSRFEKPSRYRYMDLVKKEQS